MNDKIYTQQDLITAFLEGHALKVVGPMYVLRSAMGGDGFTDPQSAAVVFEERYRRKQHTPLTPIESAALQDPQ